MTAYGARERDSVLNFLEQGFQLDAWPDYFMCGTRESLIPAWWSKWLCGQKQA